MEKIDRDRFDAARSLTSGLKAKSRLRREGLKRVAASSSPVLRSAAMTTWREGVAAPENPYPL
jgi:hypothetical protein